MRRESPIKRRNPSGKIVWVARYTGRDGKHHIAKPTWNCGKGTFERKADAQRAIEEAYGISDKPDTSANTPIPGPSAILARNAPTPRTTTESAESSTWRSRAFL